MASPTQYSQQQSAPQPQLYQLLHPLRLLGPNDTPYTRGQFPIHIVCGKHHPIGSC